jgi:hypothetical protein
VTGSADADRAEYVQALLALYRTVPGVLGHVRRADRDLAAWLFAHAVPFYAVRNAFLVAATRRIKHNAFSSPMPPIRSLHYFLPVIQEVLNRPPGYRELDQMRDMLAQECPTP